MIFLLPFSWWTVDFWEEEEITPNQSRGSKMSKPRRPRAADDDRGSELVPIKIRRSTYRLVKMAAAWLDLSALDYLDRAVRAAVSKDLASVSEDIAKELKGRQDE